MTGSLTHLLIFLGFAVLIFAAIRIYYRPMFRMLPLETPEAMQVFWDRLQKRHRVLGRIIGMPLGVIIGLSISGLFFGSPTDLGLGWIVRIDGLSVILGILGLMLTLNLAFLPLDRGLRQTTWSTGTQLRTILGWALFRNGIWFGLLAGAETARRFTPDETNDLGWRLALFLMMEGGFIVTLFVCSMAGMRLLGAVRMKDPELLATVKALCTAAGVKVPRSIMIPDRGGKNPLAAVTGKSLLVSEYLMRELTGEEMRAIIAHEVGHLAGRDPARRGRLILWVALMGLLPLGLLPQDFFITLSQDYPVLFILIPLTPLFLMTLLVLRRYRQQELQADRFGARLIGSAELMAGTLEKLHDLACLPARFPKEKKMTHPSLVNRLKSLRGEEVEEEADEDQAWQERAGEYDEYEGGWNGGSGEEGEGNGDAGDKEDAAAR